MRSFSENALNAISILQLVGFSFIFTFSGSATGGSFDNKAKGKSDSAQDSSSPKAGNGQGTTRYLRYSRFLTTSD